MKAAFFWKAMSTVIYAVSFPQFTKTLNQVFDLSSANENFGILYAGLIWTIERIKAISRYFHRILFKQMDIISKM